MDEQKEILKNIILRLDIRIRPGLNRIAFFGIQKPNIRIQVDPVLNTPCRS